MHGIYGSYNFFCCCCLHCLKGFNQRSIFQCFLNPFQPGFRFYIETKGFLVFSKDIKGEHWPEMGL